MKRKGIILAGGSGTRLHPITLGISKQLLPIYDKPMIYYPLSVLMLAGIRDILVISTPEDPPRFQQLLGDGSQLGIALQLRGAAQPRTAWPRPLSSARLHRRRPSAPGSGRQYLLRPGLLRATAAGGHARESGATVFGYHVNDPERYGVVEFDDRPGASPSRKSRKPKIELRGHRALFLRQRGGGHRQAGKALARGELEITDVNRAYLEARRAQRRDLGPRLCLAGYRHPRQPDGGQGFIDTLEKRQGLKVACPEEIAYRMGLIDRSNVDSGRWPC